MTKLAISSNPEGILKEFHQIRDDQLTEDVKIISLFKVISLMKVPPIRSCFTDDHLESSARLAVSNNILRVCVKPPRSEIVFLKLIGIGNSD
ncbi:hypothetical protein TNCV_1981041 [Trichonephila clavipes]|nr:hypothetical protein TNCV_1981041 [Trichonephila clavipes]